MYVAGLVIPVPEEKIEAYRKWAENGSEVLQATMDASRSSRVGRISFPTAN